MSTPPVGLSLSLFDSTDSSPALEVQHSHHELEQVSPAINDLVDSAAPFSVTSSLFDRSSTPQTMNLDLYDDFIFCNEISSISSEPVLSSTLSDFYLQQLFDSSSPSSVSNFSDIQVGMSPQALSMSNKDQHLNCSVESDFNLHLLFQSEEQDNSVIDNIVADTVPSKTTTKWLFPTIWFANVRGGLVSKLDEIQTVLAANNVSIAAIVETWLHDGIDSQLVQIPGYNTHRRDRGAGLSGGGLVLFAKENLHAEIIAVPQKQNSQTFEVMWFSYRAHRMPRCVTHLLIAVVYHPPAANNSEMNEYLIAGIDYFTKLHPGCGVIILGDFNRLPEGSLQAYPLKQLVTSPTREAAILDKVFTNVDRWYTNPLVLPAVGNSDHLSVLWSPTDSPPSCKGRRIHFYRRSADPTGKAMLCYALKHFNWTSLYHMETSDSQVSYFYKVLHSLLDQYLPQIRITKYTQDKPWVTTKFRELVCQRQRALLLGNRQEYCKLRNRVKRMSLSLRKRYYENKVKALHDADPHSWWTRTKQFISTKVSDPLSQLQVPDGQCLAEVINSHFVEVSSDFPPANNKFLTLLTDTDLCQNYIIEPYAVENKLSKLNTFKAPGPDGIPTWLLKECAPYLSEPLAAMFNTSLTEGHFPAIWKSAEVIPVPKITPARHIDSDLRPIALLPVVAKVCESFIRSWLLEFISPNIDSYQFGSLKGRSTTHALTSILHTWQSALDKRHSIRALLVDFSKAFDRVDHNILLKKLHDHYNIPHCLLRWFFSYLSNRHQRVRARGKLSTWRQLCGSMPQGSLLGTLSFLVLVNDLAPGCLTHKYVDDTTMTEILHTPSTQSHMSQYFQALLQWTEENHMSINTKKTKELVIGSWDQLNNSLLDTGSGTIERITEFKLLGLYVNNKLSWDKHIDYVVRKATKRLYFLKILKRAGLPHDHLLHYYIAVIRPVLEYCSCVWHHNLNQNLSVQIESIQKRAMRIIFECTRDMPYVIALSLAGLSSLQHRRADQAKEFFQSVLQPGSCLHALLPPPRDTNLTSRLRAARKFPSLASRTKKYQSFLNFSLLNYQ